MISKDTGTGTPIIFIHGFGVNSLILQSLEETIDFSGWRRIYIDLPWTRQGLDPSVKSSNEILHTVEQEVLDYLDQEPFALVGNSFGAMIARSMAHRQRGRVLGLATLAGVFEPQAQRRTVPQKSVVFEDAEFISALGEHKGEFTDISVIQDKPNYQRFLEYVIPGLLEADAGIMEQISAQYAVTPVPEEVASEPFGAPALHLFGRQDHIVGYRDGLTWLDHYSRGTYLVLDMAGHNLHLEQPHLVKAVFEDWLLRMKLENPTAKNFSQ
ncbi:alpha/beta fold hydrolase [Rothia sp. CCM 9417]|uniref:alpha/beta fold hydrolase n=1 Tax=Rothia sp. CCM 9417 TaxID=3402657 RepID=UPI003ADF3FC1